MADDSCLVLGLKVEMAAYGSLDLGQQTRGWRLKLMAFLYQGFDEQRTPS